MGFHMETVEVPQVQHTYRFVDVARCGDDVPVTPVKSERLRCLFLYLFRFRRS